MQNASQVGKRALGGESPPPENKRPRGRGDEATPAYWQSEHVAFCAHEQCYNRYVVTPKGLSANEREVAMEAVKEKHDREFHHPNQQVSNWHQTQLVTHPYFYISCRNRGVTGPTAPRIDPNSPDTFVYRCKFCPEDVPTLFYTEERPLNRLAAMALHVTKHTHRRDEHNPDGGVYICICCDTECARLEGVNSHQRTYHSGEEGKSYYCAQCGKDSHTIEEYYFNRLPCGASAQQKLERISRAPGFQVIVKPDKEVPQRLWYRCLNSDCSKEYVWPTTRTTMSAHRKKHAPTAERSCQITSCLGCSHKLGAHEEGHHHYTLISHLIKPRNLDCRQYYGTW